MIERRDSLFNGKVNGILTGCLPLQKFSVGSMICLMCLMFHTSDAAQHLPQKPESSAQKILIPSSAETPPKKETKQSRDASLQEEALDLYGVVVSVKTGKPSQSGQLSKPLDSTEIIQNVLVRLDTKVALRGVQKQRVWVENVLGENPAYNIPIKLGARVLLTTERNPVTGKRVFYIVNRDRTPALMILGVLFVLGVLLIGGSKVTRHALLVTLLLTGCYKALFPAILAGTTGLNWILLMCFTFTILGSFIYQRPGSKSFSREQSVMILGTLGGLLIMGGILWIMHDITPLNGFSNEGMAALWYQSPRMDYWTFFLSGALIGFQGFLFYLCWMLAQSRPETEPLSFRQRFDLIMLRGRRLLGPMISSLGLLFLGLFMPVLLQLQGTSTAQFINLESTTSVLIYAFAGGLSLILTVPMIALISAWIMNRPSVNSQ